jgi:hypothetical protein
MRRVTMMAMTLLIFAGPSFASMQKDRYSVPCSVLWPAVKDAVRNSGYYAVIVIDNTEMIASFAMGGGNTFRIDSAVLNAKGDSCEMQVQPLYEGPFSNDAGDFKKRVDKSLARLQSVATTKPESPSK